MSVAVYSTWLDDFGRALNCSVNVVHPFSWVAAVPETFMFGLPKSANLQKKAMSIGAPEDSHGTGPNFAHSFGAKHTELAASCEPGE